ncbi:MAG: ABC transporter permease [Deferribacterota bacterium]|nr:ABC transporter permease [Deferribacterota bacterium]
MRKLIITLKIVTNVLRSYKGRAILAIIGIFLGSLSLTLVFNILLSIKQNVLNEVEKFGDRIITVVAGEVVRAGRDKSIDTAKTMTLNDVNLLKNQVIDILDISPYIKRSITVRYKEAFITTNLIATSHNYFKMRKLELKEGMFFNKEDTQDQRKVVVLGSEIDEKIDNKTSLINNKLVIKNSVFNINGVIKEKGTDINGNNLDDVVFVPITTYMNRLDDIDYIDYIDGMEMKITSWEKFPDIEKSIKALLRESHGLDKDMEDDFTIINPIDARRLRSDVVSLVDSLGKITSVISFLIGGLGIFSIMLLIVGLRRYEIGIKRAVGAKKRDIFLQFIYESTFITVSGTIVGIIFGISISLVIFSIASLPAIISTKGILFSFLSCIFIGFFSGVYPAYIAARLKPIDIIR